MTVSLRKLFARAGLWVATVAICALALAIYYRSGPTEAANFGNFLAGVVSAIALLWLVAGYRLQTQELANQRRELELQRLALEQQAKELSATASLSSLAQIHSLLEGATAAVAASDFEVSGPAQILAKLLPLMTNWNTITESHDPNEVQLVYMEWFKGEACARGYVSDVATAMKLYLDHNRPDLKYDPTKPPEDFVYVYQNWVTSAPYLSKHVGVAWMLANFLYMFRPGLDLMQLAWLCASAKLLNASIIKGEHAEELRKRALDRGQKLPRICDPWPFEKSQETGRRLPLPK